MPRGARIDSADAVHHIMARGIERKQIFDVDVDRDHFLHRLGDILLDTGTTCFTWSLMPNHFHLLCRTGHEPISTVMRRLLTGYAVWYNRSRDRHGHLFQNRFKSILCQADAYLLRLVRYIHLNPLRAGLARDMDELDMYPYSGHGTLMGLMNHSWQETAEVLRLFGNKPASARRAYRIFMNEGIQQGRERDLAGGGLIRSAGGWEAIKRHREEGHYQRSDERILGDAGFVTRVLAHSKETIRKSDALRNVGVDLNQIASRVSDLMGISIEDVWAAGKQQHIVNARSLLCFWAVRELGVSMASLGRTMGLSLPAISKSVVRGRKIAESNGFCVIGS